MLGLIKQVLSTAIVAAARQLGGRQQAQELCGVEQLTGGLAHLEPFPGIAGGGRGVADRNLCPSAPGKEVWDHQE